MSISRGPSKWLSWDLAERRVPCRLPANSRQGGHRSSSITRDSPRACSTWSQGLSGLEGTGHLPSMWLNHAKITVGQTLSSSCFSRGHLPQPGGTDFLASWPLWQTVLWGHFQVLGDIPLPLSLIGPRCSPPPSTSFPPTVSKTLCTGLQGCLGLPHPVAIPLDLFFFFNLKHFVPP